MKKSALKEQLRFAQLQLDYAKGKPFGVECSPESPMPLEKMMKKFSLVTIGNDFHGYPYEPRDKKLAVDMTKELMSRLEEAHRVIML